MIGAIEQAIIGRIQAASEGNVLGYRLRTVKSYGGELSPDAINEAIRAFPAVWVVYGGDRPPVEIATDRVWRYQPRFAVYVGASNLRNEAAARQGAAAGEVGSYQILQDVRRLLVGYTLGLAITPLVPGEIRTVVQDRGISIYVLTLLCGFEDEALLSLPRERLDDFVHLHLDWDVPPLGNVTPPLPAAEADARDDVFLEGAD
jgi:phage gp37-like protein